jgi:N-acetylglutamate synthase-like GNAT family acetyltransferase
MEGRIDPPSSLESIGIEAIKKKAQDEILIVAHDDEKLVGCASAALRDDCVYLSKVAVALTSRRQGITRSMFKAADEIARQHGNPYLELQTRIELIENHVTFGALGFVRVAETAHSALVGIQSKHGGNSADHVQAACLVPVGHFISFAYPIDLNYRSLFYIFYSAVLISKYCNISGITLIYFIIAIIDFTGGYL